MKKRFLTVLISAFTFTAFAQLNNGLVAHYNFNSNDANDLINDNDGTIYGATSTTDRFGNANQAYSFDGVDDYIIIPHIPENDLNNMSNGITVSFWVNPTLLPSSGLVSLVTKWDGSTNEQYGVFMDAAGNNVSTIRSINNSGLTDNAAMVPGNWYHVVFTYDMNTTQHIIKVNNVVTQNVSPGGTYSASTNYTSLSFGAQAADLNGGMPSPWRFFNGKLDDVRIYNRVLTAQEIDSLYNESNPNSTVDLNEGLVAKYSFNSGNAQDEIGTNDGTVNGATLSTDRFGNTNHAYSFDGIDDHILLGDATEFQMGNNDFSISLWVNYSVAQQASVISKRAGASSNFNMYTVTVMNDPQFGGASEKLLGFTRSSTSSDRAMDAGIQSGAWHHVVLYHDYSDSTSLIVDGVTVSTSTAAITGLFDMIGEPLVLGFAEEANSNFYNGKIDDIRVYRRLLNSSEINALLNDADPATVSINEINPENLLHVFPNPAHNDLVVNSKNATQISLIDITGKIIFTKNINGNSVIDLSDISSGIYLLRDNQTQQVLKIVKE